MGMPSVNEGAVYFPVEEQVPETKWHLELRTIVYQFLKLAFADRATVGCDQFVYWNRRDPRFCLAPDAFLYFGAPDRLFKSWKVWERGTPQLAVEIISDSDDRDADWETKLDKYERLGVLELVRFDPEDFTLPLRLWFRSENELVEQLPDVQSRTTQGYWRVVADRTLGQILRLSRDPGGEQLYLTPVEEEAVARAAAEQGKAAAEQGKAAAEQGKAAAEQRIRELEAELARRSSP